MERKNERMKKEEKAERWKSLIKEQKVMEGGRGDRGGRG